MKLQLSALIVACLFIFAIIAGGGYWFGAWHGESTMIGQTLVLEWGDRLDDNGNIVARGTYGAHAFVVKEGDGYAAFARVYIGGPDYYHDGGILGQAKSMQEAKEKWGQVTWTADAVYFGEPRPGPCRILRQDFQRHR